MKIEVSDAALKWFKDEIGLDKGDNVKIYTQIYGSSAIQKGYSLGFSKNETPINMAVSTDVEGITFFVEKDDLWFFDGHDLRLAYNEQTEELVYDYVGK